MVDDIIDASALPSGGAYTAVGTYHHGEMLALCSALAERTGEPVPALVHCESCYRILFHPDALKAETPAVPHGA